MKWLNTVEVQGILHIFLKLNKFYTCIFLFIKRCRHALIADHFGDILHSCVDRCDNCLKQRNIDEKTNLQTTSSSSVSSQNHCNTLKYV